MFEYPSTIIKTNIINIITLNSPQVIILLILLVSWLDLPAEGAPFQVVEVFSGVGRIAGLAETVGYKSAAIDIEIGNAYAQKHQKRSPMDINSNAGLAFPGNLRNQFQILTVLMF